MKKGLTYRERSEYKSRLLFFIFQYNGGTKIIIVELLNLTTMDANKIENLAAEIKKICPLDVTVVSAGRRKFLAIIKYPAQEVDLHDWAVGEVHPLHCQKIYPLIKNAGQPVRIRALYCCGSRFVLYSPDFGVDIFCRAGFPIQYDCFGYEERYKYVGTCEDVDSLITFLKEKIR